jgi:AraC-like DNA-binding protein
MAAGNYLPQRRSTPTVAPAAPALSTQPRIVALVLGRLERARLQDAVRSRAVLEAVDTVASLEQVVSRSIPRVVAVIAEPWDLHHTPTAPALARLRAEYPGVALVGYCQPGHKHSGEILALARAGVHELVFRGVDDSGIALQQALARASQSSASREVLNALRPLVSAKALVIVEACVQYAWPNLSSRALASALGMNVKTLVKHCRTNALPAPGALLNWVRLMVVAYLLQAEGRALEQVAAALGLDSASPLRNLIKRYTGLRALEVRGRGGLPVVIEAFLRDDAYGRQRLHPLGAGEADADSDLSADDEELDDTQSDTLDIDDAGK